MMVGQGAGHRRREAGEEGAFSKFLTGKRMNMPFAVTKGWCQLVGQIVDSLGKKLHPVRDCPAA